MNRLLFILFVLVLAVTLMGCTDNRNIVELSLFDQCVKINKVNCDKVYEKTKDAFISGDPKPSIINDQSDPFGTVKSVFVIEDAAFKIKFPDKKPISQIYFESTGKHLFENTVPKANETTTNEPTERASVRFVDDLKDAIKMCGNPNYSDSISYGDYIPVTMKRKLENFTIKCKESSLEKSMEKK